MESSTTIPCLMIAASWCMWEREAAVRRRPSTWMRRMHAQRWFLPWKSDVEQRLLWDVSPFTVSDEMLVADGNAAAIEHVEEDDSLSDVELQRLLSKRLRFELARPPAPKDDAQQYDSLSDVELQRLLCKKLGFKLAWAPAPKDGRPSGGPNADMTELRRRILPFKNAVEEDLSRLAQMERYRSVLFLFFVLCTLSEETVLHRPIQIQGTVERRGAQKGRWKEKGMKGMRAVAETSAQPLGQQRSFVGLKKTLELDDDDDGGKWRIYEYTPLLPCGDGSDKLKPTVISLRVEFKDGEPSPPSSSKRSRSGAPKDGPRIAPKRSPSPVWEHMTKVVVHDEIAAANKGHVCHLSPL